MEMHRYAVYAPPQPGMPFLSVEISKRGGITALAFDDREEAECHARYLRSEGERYLAAA